MGKQLHILLVDDNRTTIGLNKLLIQKVDSSAELLTAPDGKAALQILNDCVKNSGKFPDIILVDLKMPVMDGLEFYKHFRNSFTRQAAETKVVMLTTSLNAEDLQHATNAGILHYLNKPLTTQKLKEVFAREVF